VGEEERGDLCTSSSSSSKDTDTWGMTMLLGMLLCFTSLLLRPLPSSSPCGQQRRSLLS